MRTSARMHSNFVRRHLQLHDVLEYKHDRKAQHEILTECFPLPNIWIMDSKLLAYAPYNGQKAHQRSLERRICFADSTVYVPVKLL